MLTCVDDLYWMLSSPSLLRVEEPTYRTFDDAWFLNQTEKFKPHFAKLRSNPAPLVEHLSHLKTYRLGAYFEQLIRYWLNHNERYECVEQNLIIRENKQTLGEFDFIVFDHEKQQFCHWEIALKFYLGVGNINCLRHWHGPNKKDRLDIKFQHLCDKQIQLSMLPAAKSYLNKKGIVIKERVIWIKGRLFYPVYKTTQDFAVPKDSDKSISESHLKGGWINKTAFLNELQNSEPNEITFSLLSKKDWLTNKTSDQWSPSDFHPLVSSIENPAQIEIFNPKLEHSYPKRFFVVPDNWSPF